MTPTPSALAALRETAVALIAAVAAWKALPDTPERDPWCSLRDVHYRYENACDPALILSLLDDRERVDTLSEILATRRVVRLGRQYAGGVDDEANEGSRYDVVLHGSGDYAWNAGDLPSVRALIDALPTDPRSET